MPGSERDVLRGEDYNKLIVISHKNAEADKNRAIARFNSKNVTEAIEDFKTGLKFDFQQDKINEYRELQKAIDRLKYLENQI
ncbi:MAG: hypothetical protein QNJ38_23890 [Prochloraceae cyanobacterium]|nr:hypothetical protein [Prochloraceae cyanobacterium]